MQWFSTQKRVAGNLSGMALPKSGTSQMLIKSLRVQSDLVGSILKFMRGTVEQRTSAVAAQGQAVLTLEDATGLTVGSTVIVEPLDTTAPTYGAVIAQDVNAKTITLAANLATAVPAGARVTKVVEAGRLAVGNATVALDMPNGAIWAFPAGISCALELNGTAAANIDLCTGAYV